MIATRDCDVLVIGGGPAGSTVAARLAELGHDVVLVDRGRPARRRETLAPGTVDLLALTGADVRVRAAGFDRVTASVVDWGRGPQVRRAAGEVLLVDRARFDDLLLARSAELGVFVMRPGIVRRRRDADAADVTTPDGQHRVRARFVVDAAGRRRAGGGVTAPATVALTAHVAGPVTLSPSVHARPGAWFWCAPAPGGCQVTAFTDPGAVSPTRLLRALVADAGIVPADGWRITGRAHAVDATPTLATTIATPTSLRVGDAAVALDPLSSTGVQKAVQGALTAAVVVNTVLRRAADASAALDHHRRAVLTTAEHHGTWAAESYADAAGVFGTPFWRTRAAGSPPPAAHAAAAPAGVTQEPPDPERRVRVSRLATIVSTTRVDGEFVTTGSAVRHPGLDGEVAYVGGVALVPLLDSVAVPSRLADVVRIWSAATDPAMAARLAGWLYRRGVLEEVEVA